MVRFGESSPESSNTDAVIQRLDSPQLRRAAFHEGQGQATAGLGTNLTELIIRWRASMMNRRERSTFRQQTSRSDADSREQ